MDTATPAREGRELRDTMTSTTIRYRIGRNLYDIAEATDVLWQRGARVDAVVDDAEMVDEVRVVGTGYYDPAEQGSTDAERRDFLRGLVSEAE